MFYSAKDLFKRKNEAVPLLGCTMVSPSLKIKFKQLKTHLNQYEKSKN